jgi:hypothetical protein
MSFVIAAAFGLCIGALFAYGAFPRRWLPTLLASVLLLMGIGEAVGPMASPLIAVIIGLAGVLGLSLTLGFVWRDHPLLAGSGYWSRVWISTAHSRALSRSLADAADGDEPAARHRPGEHHDDEGHRA